MPDELYLMSPLFVEGEEEQRCTRHLVSGMTLTISGLSPSGKRRELSGVVKSIMRGSCLHPGYPLMLTIREKVAE